MKNLGRMPRMHMRIRKSATKPVDVRDDPRILAASNVQSKIRIKKYIFINMNFTIP